MKLGLTQSALAEKANVSQPLIARIEAGDVDPRLSTLRSIISALDEMERSRVTAKDLMTAPGDLGIFLGLRSTMRSS